MSTDSVGIIINFLCCGAIIAIPAIIFYLILNSSKRSQNNSSSAQKLSTNENINPNLKLILEYLKRRKLAGKTTIDELIEELEVLEVPKQVEIEKIQENVQVEKNTIQTLDSSITNSREKIIEPTPIQNAFKISSAEVLLYLGSFLITFAILVLVALGWTAIPGIVKTVIVMTTVIAFYIGGFIFLRIEKLKNVGLTFLTVAAIASPLAFLGLWNFNLVGNVSFTFTLYWTIISIIVIAINTSLLNFVSRKRFFYLLEIAIYSLIISLAFTLTDDSNFRIVIIAILNLFFYLSERIFSNYSKEVKIVSRIVNFILNIAIVMVVAGLASNISSDYEKVLASLAMLIPTIFIGLSYLKDKGYIETGIELVIFCAKLLLIGIIFGFTFEVVCIIFGLLALIYILKAEFIFEKVSKFLYFESFAIAGLILAGINFAIFLTWISKDLTQFSTISILYILALTIFSILFIPLKREKYQIAGFGLTYLIFVLSRIIGLINDRNDLIPYIYSYLGFGLVLGGILIYAKKFEKKFLLDLVQPIGESMPILALFFVLFKFEASHISIVYMTFVAFYFARSFILNSKITRTFSYILFVFAYPAILNVSNANGIIRLYNAQDYSLAFLFPAITFFVICEFERFFKTKNYPEEIATILFSSFGLLLSVADEKVFWINLLVITIFLIVRFISTLSKTLLVSIYVLTQVLIIIGLNILNKSTNDISWTLTFVNMILLLGSTVFGFISKIDLEEKFKNLIKLLSHTSAIFIILLTIISIGIDQNILWFNFLTLFIYSILKLLELKRKEILIVNFSLLQILVILGSSILKLSYQNTLLAVSITDLIIASFGLFSNLISNSEESKELSQYFNYLNLIAICFNFFLLFTALLSILGSHETIYSVILAIEGLTILISNNSTIKKLSGIAFVFAIWNLLNQQIGINFQFYIIPITIYGLALAGISYIEGKKQQSEIFEVTSYCFQMTAILGESLLSSTDSENVFSGIILIGISVLLIILGLFRNKKSIWISATIFLILELLIRFFFVIVLIPWWLYVGLIGIGLIALASFIIYKSSAKK